MKKVFIIILGIFILFIIALITIPVFFKSDILRLIEEQSSKYMKADLKIGDVNLSMFKNFPDLSVTLTDVMLSENRETVKDTLIRIPEFEASVNLKSLISGNEIIINRILLKDCRLMPQVTASGRENWDIMIASDSTGTATPQDSIQTKTDASGKSVRFNHIEIRDLYLDYKDFQSSTYFSIDKINLELQGNLSETNTLLQILLHLENICFRQGNSVWVNNTNFNWQADIEANLKEMLFHIKKNDMSLNDLKLDLTGNVGIGKEKYDMDLKLNAPDTQFESLLAMVPKEFQKEIEGVKTSGGFQLNATAKGEYYENHLPQFDIQFNILDASLKYPELPESIEKINLKLSITNPGGTPSLTVADLRTLSFSVADNPFDMSLLVSNPEDPTLRGEAKGVINFESLKKALPLQDITLNGILSVDMAFNGKYQYIEKEQYEKFSATGKISLKDVLFKNSDFPKGIVIPSGDLTVTPARLNLKNLSIQINSSDLTLEGYVADYLPYIFKNQTLKGNFNLNSKLLNLNELMANIATDTTQIQKDNASSSPNGVFEVPKNIQLGLNTNVKTLLFDQLTVKNINGNVQTAGGVATLKNLSMDMLEGKILMNGSYNTTHPAKPFVDFNLRIDDFDIDAAYHAFSFIKQSIPMAMNCSGKISTVMKFSANLDQEMSPIMNTVNGGGSLSTAGFLIKDNPAMAKLATLLKNDELSRISISKLKIDFKLDHGNIIIEPFTTHLAGNPTTIYGSQTVNGEMDYTLSMNIDRKYFGKDINNVLSALPRASNIKALDVDVKIEGTLDKPIVKPDLTKAIKAVEKEAGKEVKKNILKGLDKLFKKK